jgi:hypothetical protein
MACGSTPVIKVAALPAICMSMCFGPGRLPAAAGFAWLQVRKRLQPSALCDQTGFQKINTLTGYSAPALAEPFRGWKKPPDAQASALLEYARSSPTVLLCSGLIDLVWQWASINLFQIHEMLREERAWQREESAAWMALVEDEDEGKRRLYLQFIACSLESLPEYLLDLRRLAAQLKLPDVMWIAPLAPDLQPGLEAAGFQREWEGELFIYEKT